MCTCVVRFENYRDMHVVQQALDRTAGPNTLILLGVTRTDTGPAFFDALDKVSHLQHCHRFAAGLISFVV